MDEVLADKMQFYGKKVFAGLSLALAILFTVPTIAIMASWNALPGEKLYSTKRYLENIALKIVGNNFTARADLQTQFVEQRFNEAEILLAQSSSSGINDLAQQINVTKTDIISARNRVGSKDSVVAQQKAAKLSLQLKEYSQKLEVSKQTNSNNRTTTPNVVSPVMASKAPSATSLPTSTPLVVPQPVVAPGTVDTVDALQEEIAKTIEELKQASALTTDTKKEEGKEEVKNNNKDKIDESKVKPNDNNSPAK